MRSCRELDALLEAKIAIVPDGHEHALRWSARHSQRTGRDTVVLIGSLAPHKNVALILGLARRLVEAGLRIAVSGTRDDRVFNADGAAVPAADNIIWLGRLSDDELARVLTDCLCLAFPSFTEGFGLLPLEAMALGCPVVASDQASLPEICGALDAAPTDADAWLRQLVRISRNERLRARLADSGRLVRSASAGGALPNSTLNSWVGSTVFRNRRDARQRYREHLDLLPDPCCADRRRRRRLSRSPGQSAQLRIGPRSAGTPRG